MQTVSLVVRAIWQKLENTEVGCLLQTEAGATVYYTYSEYAPNPESLGYEEDAQGGPSRLRGGHIWVKSRDWSRISVTPFNVDAENVDPIIGDIDDLEVPADNLVEALNYVYEKVNVIEAGRDYTGDIEITSVMLDNKGLTLPFAPTGIVYLCPYGGIPQQQGVDFLVSGSQLTWDSLSLEILLEAGDIVNISYKRG